MTSNDEVKVRQMLTTDISYVTSIHMKASGKGRWLNEYRSDIGDLTTKN